MTDKFIDKSMINKPVIGVAIAVVLATVGGWLYWRAHNTPLPQVSISEQPPVAAPAPEAQNGSLKGPLPELGDSDKAMSDALGEAAGGAAITPYLVPESIIRHI